MKINLFFFIFVFLFTPYENVSNYCDSTNSNFTTGSNGHFLTGLTTISVASDKKDFQNELKNTWADKSGDFFRIRTGADITNYGQPGLSQYISLLGLSNRRTLIKLDGRKINSFHDGNANLNHIPISLIRDIEIKKGVDSVLDDPGIFGGSVNLTTGEASPAREPLSETPYTRLYSRWGTAGLEVYGLNFENRNGSLQYSIFSEKRFSRGYGFYKKENKYNAVNFYGKMDWYYSPKTWFTLSMGKYEDEVGLPKIVGFGNDKNKDKHIQLKYETHLQETAFKVRFYNNKNRLEHNDKIDIFVSENNTQGNEEIVEQHIAKYHLIRIGKAHHWNKFDGNFLVNTNTNIVNKEDVFFFEDEITLNDLTLSMGQRYDKNSFFPKEKSPRFRLNYKLEDKTIFFLSAGKGISFPNVNDLYLPLSVQSIEGITAYYQGNPSLIPEKGWVYTLGFEKNISESLSLNLTGHFADVKNFLLWNYNSNLGYFQSENISSIISKGAETGLRFSINKNIGIQTIYTYLKAFDNETKNNLPYRPENKFKTNLLYNNIKYNGDLVWLIELSHEYQGKRYSNRENSKKLESFSIVNLNISMKLAKAFTINLAANNLDNNEYALVDDYPMPGRNFWGGVVWEFLN